MPCLSSTQLRALSAAAGVVGRPHLRTGLLLTLAVACGPVDPGDADDATTAGDPATTAGTTTAASTSGDEPTSSGGTGSADASSSLASTSGDELTTGATLLTEFATTGATDTGDLTGETGATTGDLDDCIDPATLEVDWVCCEAQNWMPQPQCTPWGPPAPPAASHDLLARARAARTRLA